jgi:RNA polymerase sigma factor (sigma-70 family)
MTKTIILSDRGPVEMTYEEVLKQFTPMIEKFAWTACNKSDFNKPDHEEVLQELKLQTWIAYERYDGTNAFSTYLVFYLQGAIHRSTFKMYAKKRNNEAGFISLNQSASDEDEMSIESVIGEEDVDISSLAFRDFIENLEKNIDPVEKKILRLFMDKTDYSVRDLGDELGISRQGANKKVIKFKHKMAKILTDAGFVTC